MLGVHILSLERSPKVGFARSPWAIKKRNSKLTKDSECDKRLWSEADLLKKLNHPNIVGFRAFTLSSKGEPCLAMEQLDISLGIYVTMMIWNVHQIKVLTLL